jgi:hypothetical protein
MILLGLNGLIEQRQNPTQGDPMPTRQHQKHSEIAEIERSQPPSILAHLANSSAGLHLNLLVSVLSAAGVLVVIIAIVSNYAGLIDFRLTKDGLHLQIDGNNSHEKVK